MLASPILAMSPVATGKKGPERSKQLHAKDVLDCFGHHLHGLPETHGRVPSRMPGSASGQSVSSEWGKPMRHFAWPVVALFQMSAVAAQEPFILDPIFVEAASRDVRELLDTPATVSVLETDDLEGRMATTFEELIGDTPGVSIEGGPRGIAQEPNIRGFQDEQIVLRFDGGRFNFNQAHRGRFFVDPEILKRVEVVRGGGSTLYGSGALGGVIAVETKDADDLLEPGRSGGARVNFGYASNGEMASGGLTVFGRQGAVDGLAFFGWRGMGADLDDGSGETIRNSQLDMMNGLVKFGFEPNEAHRLEMSLSRYGDDGTTPPNANAVSTPDSDVERDAEVTTARLSWDYAPAGSNAVDLSVLLYANELEIIEETTAGTRIDETRYDTYGMEVVNRSHLDLGRPVRLVYGIEAVRDSQEGLRDGAAREQFPDAEATTFAAFGEATIALSDRFELIPGLRYDVYKREPDAAGLADVDEGFLSPRLGVSYRPNENWQIYGNVARAFRAPSLTELYNDGVHFAMEGFPLGPGTTFSGINRFVPDPDLEPEKSTQVEIGARFSRSGVMRAEDSLGLSVNAYYADVKDYMDQTVTFIDFSTAVPGPDGLVVDGTTTTENVDAKLWGFEAELDYDAKHWFAGIGLSLPRGEGEDGEPLGSIPQDRLTVTLGYRPSEPWEIGGRATFAARQDDVPEGSLNGESFTTLDLFATWRPDTPALRGAVLRVGVDNLFDETYAIYPNGLNQPGRTVKLSASMAF